MSCNPVRICYTGVPVGSREGFVYVCNCNGIRERDVRDAIDQGGQRAAHVFRHCGARPQCAKCVHDIRRMIEARRETLKFAAE